MHEAMAVYQYVYGLKPIGPHRPVADELMTPLRVICGMCTGTGLRPSVEGEWWSLCPYCEGTQGVWRSNPEEVEARRREVLRRFPDAKVAHSPSNFVSPTLAFHLESGRIVELTEERSGGELPALGVTSIPLEPTDAPLPLWSHAETALAPVVKRSPPPTPRMRKKRPVGTSAHGLEFNAVVHAFQTAERELGTTWQMTGEGHCRRVTLDGRYSRHVRPATRSWEMKFRGFPGSKVAMFPLPVVLRAAELLKVKAEILIGSEY
jgi:hypothetical protein